jgi:hypothetical protein
MSTTMSERIAAGARPPRAFSRTVAAAGLPGAPPLAAPVTEVDLAGLPPAAARYLRAMGVVGRPRTWSLRAHFVGRFRLAPTQPWMSVDAWQYNSSADVARLFRMRLMFARVVPMWGWDTYRGGRGRMRGKVLNLIPVADGSGPEFDTSELVTWLNDGVLMAPAMLLDTRTSWDAVSDDSFHVSVTDAGRTVSAEVFLDEDDRPRDFRTEDRYADLPGGLVRAPWSTPEGEYRYGEMTLADLALDVPPAR